MSWALSQRTTIYPNLLDELAIHQYIAYLYNILPTLRLRPYFNLTNLPYKLFINDIDTIGIHWYDIQKFSIAFWIVGKAVVSLHLRRTFWMNEHVPEVRVTPDVLSVYEKKSNIYDVGESRRTASKKAKQLSVMWVVVAFYEHVFPKN